MMATQTKTIVIRRLFSLSVNAEGDLVVELTTQNSLEARVVHSALITTIKGLEHTFSKDEDEDA